MQATNLKTNHLTQPFGIDAGTLFLSWQCAEGVRQTAYEIEVTAGAETLWTSGKVLGSGMHTETPTPVPPKMQGQWRIRLWDENDQPGAWSTASFETGLAQADWQGVWVCPETEETVCGMAERQACRRYGASPRQLYRRQAFGRTDLRCDRTCP